MNAINNNLLVSVIIPIYNGEKYIRRSVRSVQGQEGDIALEIILVDDGSRDGSWQIMKDLQREDERINIFQQNNKGQASARNLGAANARGKYIAFLDVDDIWIPDKLEKQLVLFNKDQKLVLVYNDVEIISDESNKRINDTFSIIKPHNGDVYTKLITNGCFISTIAVLIPKYFFDKVGGFKESNEYKYIEDYELWMRISKEGNITYVPQILSRYMRRKGSSSQAKIKTIINVLRMCWNLPLNTSRGFNRLKKMRALVRHSLVLIMYVLHLDKFIIKF